mgnify:CR=1 FL=1
MGALIFFMILATCGGGITAVVFGIQVILDHLKGRTTAWSKRTGLISIILGVIVSVVLGGMLIIAIFNF